MAEVSLTIQGKSFRVNKDILCAYSDYFQAMFSGNYIENELQEIKINNLDPDTMEIILKYMQIGEIDISIYSLSRVEHIVMAANFLQITDLLKQVEYELDLQISDSNWIQIMLIAEQCSFTNLKILAISHGLLSFQKMEPHYVPSIQMLAWYLSHPCLDSESESQIFKFGYEWLISNDSSADALSIILGCLDINRITPLDINEISEMLKDYENSLTAKVINCWHDLFANKHDLRSQTLQDQKNIICEKFTEQVYTETINIVKNSTVRKVLSAPILPIWLLQNSKLQFSTQCLFSFTEENKFQKWLEVEDKCQWGWNVVSWKPNKIVIVCGEHGRGTGIFMRDVKVYDTLRKAWTWHGVQLPHRRHAGCTVVGDSLFVVGGVGAFRVILDTAIIYDLRQRSFRNIANFPDAIQSPAICSLDNNIYVAGYKTIYRYQDQGHGLSHWEAAVTTNIRISCMRSYKKYIYCTQSYFSFLYRFTPGASRAFELITNFSNPTSTMCSMGDSLFAFTRAMNQNLTVVEVLKEAKRDEKPNVIYKTTSLMVNEVAGSCVVVVEPGPVEWTVSPYVSNYLQCYNE